MSEELQDEKISAELKEQNLKSKQLNISVDDWDLLNSYWFWWLACYKLSTNMEAFKNKSEIYSNKTFSVMEKHSGLKEGWNHSVFDLQFF